jgi:cytochrome c oxidase subunit 2
MNIVPGQVSWFWFTPTVPGRYEAMCAQLCGVGHSAMHGYVVVESEAAFRAWHDKLPSFAASRTPAPSAAGGDALARGRSLAETKGCTACHSIDGKAGVGPTWRGLFGKTETMADESTARVDGKFLREFIRDPKSRDIKGFPNVMPRLELTDDEIDTLALYIESLGGTAPAKP